MLLPGAGSNPQALAGGGVRVCDIVQDAVDLPACDIPFNNLFELYA